MLLTKNHFILLLMMISSNLDLALGNQVEIAKVILLRGEVRVRLKDSSEIKLLKANDGLIEGAHIQTSAKSFAKILFNDKTQLNLGPESKMVINSFPQNEPGLISLVKGKIRSKVEPDLLKKSEGNDDAKLYIRTKSAAMGIRGTDFQVVFNPENTVTSLVTFEGEVVMAQTNTTNLVAGNNTQTIQASLTSDNAVKVSEGQFSGANPQQESATIPVKISPSQFYSLQANTEFKEMVVTENSDKNNFQSPIPPLVSAKAFMGDQQEVEIRGNSEGAVSSPPAEGLYDNKTGKFTPPAGGYIDIKTGLYIPPPPGSAFDSNTGVFVPSPTAGKFDAATGNYIAPAGFVLSSDGTFKVEENTQNPSKNTEGRAGIAITNKFTPPPLAIPLTGSNFTSPAAPLFMNTSEILVNTDSLNKMLTQSEAVRDLNFINFQDQQTTGNTIIINTSLQTTTNVNFQINVN